MLYELPMLLYVTFCTLLAPAIGFSAGPPVTPVKIPEASQKWWDHFEFDITLECKNPDRDEYNVAIEWWESDTLPTDEQLTKRIFLRPKTGNFSFSMDGAMDGDEKLSAGYKPYAVITHDCEAHAKTMELELTVDTLCDIGKIFCHYRIIQDITNQSGSKTIKANALRVGEWMPFPDFRPSLL